MTAFAQTYSESTPLGTDLASGGDEMFRNDKAAVIERLELEHNALDSSATGATTKENAAAQGRHLPGRVSAFYIGTTAEIEALTGMCEGACAYDTDLAVIKIYDGSVWTTYQIGGANDIFTGTELLVSIFGSAALAAAGINYSPASWTSAPTSVASIFDRDITTFWGSSTTRCASNSLCYWDLGAVYKGNLFVAAKIKPVTATETCRCSLICTYDTLPSYTTLSSDDFSGSFAFTQNTTAILGTGIRPFFGRYVGFSFSGSDASAVYCDVSRFEVYGSAV